MTMRYAIIGPIFLFLAWAFVTGFGFVDTFFLPGPLVVLRKLAILLTSGVLLSDTVATLQRVVSAFMMALVVGLPLGLWLGGTERAYRSAEFLVDFFRSTPATALFPLFLLVFGVTDVSKIAVAAFASTLLIIFNTAHGVMRAKKSRVLAVTIMGATKAQIFRQVLFWESLPQTFIGLRSAISMSLVVIVAAEMVIGTPIGLGRRIIDAQITYNIPAMYATILFSGIIGYALNACFLVIERRLLHWSGK